ncbi:kinase-like domain-containing protein [Chytridium lagenaria]|nr:kinase-like domain-containing protein [Chytridium lagenaria]
MDIKETSDAKLTEDSGQRKLNQYLIKETLGRGSYGTVYRGVDTNNGNLVAIKDGKVYRRCGPKGRFRGRGGHTPPQTHASVAAASSNASSNPAIDLVRTEIAIMKKLNHVNVVKLYEVLHDPLQDSIFMVYELCERGTVMSVSFEKAATPLSHEQSRSYLRQMILGIEYLHEHDIPDNLLISKDGILKIVDFGVSEMFTSGNDSSKNSAGSPAFFAPELCIANHGSITLHCFLFGTLPFSGLSVVDLYEAIKAAQFTIPAGTPPAIADLLKKILEKDPAERITMDGLRVCSWLLFVTSVLIIGLGARMDHKQWQGSLPTKEENCSGMVTQLTDEDLANAVNNVNTLWTVVKAIRKFKANITPSSSRSDLASNSSLSDSEK